MDLSRRQDVEIMEKTTSCICASETEAQRYGSRIQDVSTSVIMHDYPALPQDSGLSRMGASPVYHGKALKTAEENKAHDGAVIVASYHCLGGMETDNEGLGIDAIIDLIEQWPVDQSQWNKVTTDMLRHRNRFHSPQCNSWYKISQWAHIQTHTVHTYKMWTHAIDQINPEREILCRWRLPFRKEESACRDMLKYFHVARLNIYHVMRNEKESQSWILHRFLFPWQSAHVKAIWPVARVRTCLTWNLNLSC